MSNFTALATHLIELVDTDTTLKAFLADEYLYLDLPETYPSITLGGITNVDDKQGKITLFVNLYAKSDDSGSNKLEFIDMADRLLALLKQSNCITTAGYTLRPEPENAVQRALFPCVLYLRNLA